MQQKYKSGKAIDTDIKFGYEVETLCTKEKNHFGAAKSKKSIIQKK